MRMLADVGLLSPTDRDLLLAGLDDVAGELENGTYTPGPEHEDIHMAVD